MALRPCAVADGMDPRLGTEFTGMALYLKQTKTGPHQWVEVQDPDVKELLRAAVAATEPTARLFPFPPRSFRRFFQEACKALKLWANYVPHSWRHGGLGWVGL